MYKITLPSYLYCAKDSIACFCTRKFVLFLSLVSYGLFFSSCTSNMTAYYGKLRTKIDAGEYQKAVKLVDKSQSVYGNKNMLMYYFDAGIVNHFAKDYDTSSKRFESAKALYTQYYQKSVSAGVASMFFNDGTIPYYSNEFERAHVPIFEALNYILRGRDNEAVVEARQIDTLFKNLAVEQNYKNFYKDDGFIRYFMGLVYENADYLNDAHISYYRALQAYKKGVVALKMPSELIDDAYTSAVNLGMIQRANEIKNSHPQAKKRVIPEGFGECIIVDYNGFIPEKVEHVLEFALGKIWGYVSSIEVDNTQETQDFQKAKSIGISLFANDYIKVSFPKYKDIKNRICSFNVNCNNKNIQSKLVQDLGGLAKKILDDKIGKIYAKTLARAAVKYVIGRSVSSKVEEGSGSTWGVLSQITFNLYNPLSEQADRRAWNTLPNTILMARFYLPKGDNTLVINYLSKNRQILDTQTIKVNIREGKKNFVVVRNSMIDNVQW
ncbi:MAG: hypothetical protein LBT07_01210 [Endomicrobium sp.]|jgi:hypothetical protein|nr:hypothetical protein [Endomicrobium sp.]